MATGRASSRAAVDLTFEELYRGHHADVYRAALRELGNAHDAEDVTQAAFADAYRAVLRGTRPQSPRAWLLAISENVCRRRFRTAQRRPREELVDDADLPSRAELPYEQSRALAEALAGLPEEQRRVFVLRELVGLSYAEIADETDSTVGSVQMLLFRARRSLRERLEPPTVAVRRPVFLPPVPSWLAGLAARVELATMTPRAAGTLGAAVLTIAGASVAVPVSDAVAREAARSAAASASTRAEPAAARPAAKLTGLTVEGTAAQPPVGNAAPAQTSRAAATGDPARGSARGAAGGADDASRGPGARADCRSRKHPEYSRRGSGRSAARAVGATRLAAAAAARASRACHRSCTRSRHRPGAAAGPGRCGRDRDRRGGRRWGERTADAGSLATSSDAAAGAVEEARARAALASARTQKGRGTAGRNPFSPCTVLPC